MSDKTVINNWTGGGTLQTWPDGEFEDGRFEALSAHPHASACDKQGELADDFGNCEQPGPSDRTADVTAKVRSAINGIYGLRFCQLSGGHQEDSIEKAIKKIVAIVEESVA